MKFVKSIEFYFFSFLILLVTLPILAPILSYVGLNEMSQKIYLIFSFFCHQFDTRSLHLFDYQYAWCARDTGIWIGVLAASVGYKFRFFKGIGFLTLILFVIPIGLDGGIQTINTLLNFNSTGEVADIGYYSNNLTRFLTGSFVGIGVGLFLAPNIVERHIFPKFQSFKVLKLEKIINVLRVNLNNQFRRVGSVMVGMFILYFSLVFLWAITSNEHKPTNALDSVPKVQEGFFFVRRANGECPTDEFTGILNFECLL